MNALISMAIVVAFFYGLSLALDVDLSPLVAVAR
jgi:hypothetical protein